jgi:hypothetical protein
MSHSHRSSACLMPTSRISQTLRCMQLQHFPLLMHALLLQKALQMLAQRGWGQKFARHLLLFPFPAPPPTHNPHTPPPRPRTWSSV